MNTADYQAFTTQLTRNLKAEVNVRGLVLLGSTANASHAPDAWSDHDFFVITEAGQQEGFRQRFDWLPDHEQIVLTARETEHGLKVMYRNGHLLEYAVFDEAEISLAKANDYRVVFDTGNVSAAMLNIAQTTDDLTAIDSGRMMRLCLCKLVVGAGRVARGEVISGQVFIKTYALADLLSILTQTLAANDKHRLDNLDSFRRFEQVFPETGTAINTAIAKDPINAAHGLLDVFEQYLQTHRDYPAEAVMAVRQFLTLIMNN